MLAAFFVAAGVNHFLAPATYRGIVPSYLPWPTQLVAISGVAEILGGVGVLVERTRKLAGFGLIALLIAVCPANIEAVRSGMTIAAHVVPSWILWLRLPLQLVLIAWVYRSCMAASGQREDVSR